MRRADPYHAVRPGSKAVLGVEELGVGGRGVDAGWRPLGFFAPPISGPNAPTLRSLDPSAD